MKTPQGSRTWHSWFRSLFAKRRPMPPGGKQRSLLAQLMEGEGQLNFVSHRA